MTTKNITEEITGEWMRKRLNVVAGMVQEKLGDDYETHTRIIPKNNGTAYCIEIRKKQEMVSALIHTEDFPVFYGDMQLADRLVEIYKSGDHKERLIPELEKYQQNLKETILGNVFPVLVGRKGNEEFIRGKAHLPFLDMEILFDISTRKGDEECYSVMVTEVMLNLLGITAEELLVTALENLPYKIHDIAEMIGALVLPPDIRFSGQPDPVMLVISNEDGFRGAATLLKKEALQEAAGMLGGDILILPSSVHEIICLPYEEDIVGYCWKMVEEVNESTVKPEERLTDSVYRYNLITDTVEIAGDRKPGCIPEIQDEEKGSEERDIK